MRLVRHIRSYLEKWLIHTKKNLDPKSPIHVGYNKRKNHLTLLSLYCRPFLVSVGLTIEEPVSEYDLVFNKGCSVKKYTGAVNKYQIIRSIYYY